jgi:hypothetical protein
MRKRERDEFEAQIEHRRRWATAFDDDLMREVAFEAAHLWDPLFDYAVTGEVTEEALDTAESLERWASPREGRAFRMKALAEHLRDTQRRRSKG